MVDVADRYFSSTLMWIDFFSLYFFHLQSVIVKKKMKIQVNHGKMSSSSSSSSSSSFLLVETFKQTLGHL